MPTYDTPEPISAVIDTTAGRVEIHASDPTDTVVEVRPSDPSRDADVAAAEQTQVEFADGRLSVRAPKSRLRSLIGRPPSIDVTIGLPTGSRVDAQGWADYRGQGRIGEATDDVRLKTANGDITVYRALAGVDAKTAYGGVRVGEVVRGAVVLETGFGELELGIREGTAAWLDVNSQHGTVRSDLSADDGPGEAEETVEVRARTGYGDIVIRRP